YLHTIEIFFGKSLYRQCEKLIRKAKKLAEQHEKHLHLLALYDWEMMVITGLSAIERMGEFSEKDALERKEIIRSYSDLLKYRIIEGKLLHLSKTVGFPRNTADKEQYDRIMTELPADENEAEGFWARFHHLNIYNFYYEVMGDKQNLYEYRKRLIEFAEKSPEKINDDQTRYLVALNNLLNIQDELRKTEEVEETLRKIRSVKARTTDIQIRIFTYSYLIEISQYILTGEFEKFRPLFPVVEEGMRKFLQHMNREYKLAFHYNFFYGYFGLEDYASSLKWLNKILNDDTYHFRKEIYYFTRILNLIIHFELGNTDLLAYTIKSTYRFFMKQNRMFKFETALLNFIRYTFRFNSRSEMKQGFSELKNNFNELKNDPFEQQVLSFFDFDSWLDSKISGRTFAELVREKNSVTISH
ncbi:MAG: hypothetical protein ACJ76F_03795, partial [Bacteroidia bacterium]